MQEDQYLPNALFFLTQVKQIKLQDLVSFVGWTAGRLAGRKIATT